MQRPYIIPLLSFLLSSGSVKKSDLHPIVRTYSTLDKLLKELSDEGYIDISEELSGRRTYRITLTDKGRSVASRLSSAYPPSADYELPSDFKAKFQNMSALVHFNVLDDHVAITEHNFDGLGNDRVVFLYTRPNGHNIMRLWCDIDKTFNCKHTEFGWTLPDVQEMVQIRALREGKVKDEL